MQNNEDFRKALSELLEVLDDYDEKFCAQQTRNALAGSQDMLFAFLKSNELWGGFGSIADEAGCGKELSVRRKIWAALVSLGEIQIKAGITNVRTQVWTEVFRSCIDDESPKVFFVNWQ